jgi:hypothetical protein
MTLVCKLQQKNTLREGIFAEIKNSAAIPARVAALESIISGGTKFLI